MSGERPPPMPRHPIYQLGYAAPRTRADRTPAARRSRPPSTLGPEQLKPILWVLLGCVWVALLLYAATRWDSADDPVDSVRPAASYQPPARTRSPSRRAADPLAESKDSSLVTELLRGRFLSTTRESQDGESSRGANGLIERSTTNEPSVLDPDVFVPRSTR